MKQNVHKANDFCDLTLHHKHDEPDHWVDCKDIARVYLYGKFSQCNITGATFQSLDKIYEAKECIKEKAKSEKTMLEECQKSKAEGTEEEEGEEEGEEEETMQRRMRKEKRRRKKNNEERQRKRKEKRRRQRKATTGGRRSGTRSTKTSKRGRKATTGGRRSAKKSGGGRGEKKTGT